MRTVFVGGFAARTAPRILAKVTDKLDTTMSPTRRRATADPGRYPRLTP